MKRLFLLLPFALLACNSERTPEKRGPGEGFAWQGEAAGAKAESPAEPPAAAAPAPAPAPPAPAAPTGKVIELAPGQKKLVFQDDFDRKELGPEWKVQGGDWQLKDGAVHSTKALNKCLWLTRQLPDDAVIELEAWSMTPRGDLKFTVFADGQEHETGYTLILGGWFNTISIIARMDEHGADRKERHHKGAVVPGKRYKFEMRRLGERMDWYVDGQLYLSYDDRAPLRGPGHQHFAFCNWEVPLFFDNLRVYAITGAAPAATPKGLPALGPMGPSGPSGPLAPRALPLRVTAPQGGSTPPIAPLKLRLPPRPATAPAATPSH